MKRYCDGIPQGPFCGGDLARKVAKIALKIQKNLQFGYKCNEERTEGGDGIIFIKAYKIDKSGSQTP